MRTSRRAGPHRGFTLVELVTVVVVLTLLAAVAVPSWRGVQARSQDAAAISEHSSLGRAAAGHAALALRSLPSSDDLEAVAVSATQGRWQQITTVPPDDLEALTAETVYVDTQERRTLYVAGLGHRSATTVVAGVTDGSSVIVAVVELTGTVGANALETAEGRERLADLVETDGTGTATAPPFDSTTVWQTSPSLTTGRAFHTLTLLPDGRLAAVGGFTASGATATVEVYDPDDPVVGWQPLAELPAAVYDHAAVVLDTGTLLVAGGRGSDGTPTADTYTLDMDRSDSVWEDGTQLPEPRHGFTLTRAGATLYAFGGGPAIATGLSSQSPQWYTLEPEQQPPSRTAHTAATGPDGRLHLVGGTNAAGTPYTRIDTFDPARPEDGWADDALPPIPAPLDGTVAAAAGSHLLITGGKPTWELATADTLVLDLTAPATGWQPGPQMADTRSAHAAASTTEQQVFVTGGVDTPDASPHTTVEMLDAKP